MKILLVITMAFSSAISVAAESEKSLFETSAARLSNIASSEAEAGNAAIVTALSILDSDRPALKPAGVNTESRELKVGGEIEASAIKSVLSILQTDRPALKATGVNTESRDLKAEAAAATSTTL